MVDFLTPLILGLFDGNPFYREKKLELKGKKLVVVGGAGLIGSHTVDRIIKHDVKEVVIYDNFVRGREENLANALKDPRVTIYDVGGDIMQTDILQKAFEESMVFFTLLRFGYCNAMNIHEPHLMLM